MIIPTSWALAKDLMSGGGMLIGAFAEVFEIQNGVQAIDVLVGLQILVIGAVWQVGREVAKKPSMEDVRREIQHQRR